MNRPLCFATILFALFAANCVSSNVDELPVLEGPYLGQETPGLEAEPFAPGIISKSGWELEGVFAPGMNEFYYTVDWNEYKDTPADGFTPLVIGYRMEENVWTKQFEFVRRGEVTFSPDGKRMHMAKGYRERIGDGWSDYKSLGPMFDREDFGIMRLSASAEGTYVFDDYKGGDVIRMSRVEGGERQKPTIIGSPFDVGEFSAHPFIAHDESYIIWDSKRVEGYGDSDLYISFRQPNGSWGDAINMGPTVNSEKWEAYASVTPDGRFILFNRGMDDNNDNVDIYWVDAAIIDTLKPN